MSGRLVDGAARLLRLSWSIGSLVALALPGVVLVVPKRLHCSLCLGVVFFTALSATGWLVNALANLLSALAPGNRLSLGVRMQL